MPAFSSGKQPSHVAMQTDTTAQNYRESENYREAMEFLANRENYERGGARGVKSFQLDSMRNLLRRLGDPQNAFPIVHIAGTKGKGSTAAMISAVACEQGYRVGLYTSPHLHHVEERFVVDGKPCTESQLADLLWEVRPFVEAMDRESGRGPTYFEVTTAVAMLYFAQQDVDLAVLEVGMGGRLDSTNVCDPVLTVITSVSLDHTRELGDTLPLIAQEKAGIIKRGVPVISGVVEPAARDVIREQSQENDAVLWEMDRDFEVARYTPPSTGTMQSTFDFKSLRSPLKTRTGLKLGLLGRHQASNAALALAAVDLLAAEGWKWEPPALERGLARAQCCGRIELISRHPFVVIDAAHNVASIRALLDTLEQLKIKQPRTLLFASSIDKDLEGMLRLLVPRFDHLILTRYPESSRAADPAFLGQIVDQVIGEGDGINATWEVREDPSTAWCAAVDRAGETGSICVTGSFFIAAHMRPLAHQAVPSRLAHAKPDECKPVGFAI